MIHKLAMTLLFGLFLSAGSQVLQPFPISGYVYTPDGRPLANAAIRTDGMKGFVTTDAKGFFTFNSPDSCTTLIAHHSAYGETIVPNACSGQPVRITFNLPELERKAEELQAPAMFLNMQKATRATPRQYAITPGPWGESQPAFNTEDYALIQDNRFHRATDEPLSTFSIDVDAAAYSNLRRFLKNGQLPPADAVRIEEMINYFNYDYTEPKGEHPVAIHTTLGECPWQPKHRLLQVGLQGKRLPMDNLPPSNLVFLIDVSGSMDEPNKLPLLQASFKLLADQLREQDRVAIVVYAGAAGLVLPPTSGSEKAKIKEAIAQLRAGGSTAGGEGIQLAYRVAKENFNSKGNNRVILATDGDFNVGASSDAEMVRLVEKERQSGVFLTVLGFGMGNYKDNKMQQLADKGNGNHYYIDEIGEAKKVLVQEFGGTMYTIAKDVKVQIEFNPTQVAGYRLIGYENRLLDKEDFNDDQKDAGEMGSGHTITALYEIIPAGVESAFLGKVDPLKYQNPKGETQAVKSKETCSVKVRYKAPDGTESKKLEQIVGNDVLRADQAGDNFRWAAAVAEFGMLLRHSEFKGEANYGHCKKLAENAKGADANGYRRDCIDLIDTAMRMSEEK